MSRTSNSCDDFTVRRCQRSWHSPVRASVPLLFCALILQLAYVTVHATAAGNDVDSSFPGKSWQPIPSLDKAGWSKEKLGVADAYANADSIHTSAVMVVRAGKV
jgi:hypothetical protein